MEAHVVGAGFHRGHESELPAGPFAKELEHGGVLAVEGLASMGQGGGDYAGPPVCREPGGDAEADGYVLAGGEVLLLKCEAGRARSSRHLHEEGVAGPDLISSVWPVVERAHFIPSRLKPPKLHCALRDPPGVEVLAIGIFARQCVYHRDPVLLVSRHTAIVDRDGIVRCVYVLSGGEFCRAFGACDGGENVGRLPGLHIRERAYEGDKQCRDHHQWHCASCKARKRPLEPAPGVSGVRGIRSLYAHEVPVHHHNEQEHEGHAHKSAYDGHRTHRHVQHQYDNELEEHVPSMAAYVLPAL